MPRRVTWVKAALKDFGAFPAPVQRQMIAALRMATGGEKAETAKPMKRLGSGIFEIAVRQRGDAFRAVYAVQMDEDVWVLHAFQKKSRTGIRTPKQEIDLVRERIRRVQEQLR
jgi:phage-related protein